VSDYKDWKFLIDRIFQEKVEEILQEKLLISLLVGKINDGMGFKDNFGS